MGNIIQNMVGLGDLTEQVIATDLLIAAKSGIKCYASALSKTSTLQVRSVFKRHFDDCVDAQEKIATYMINKGYYHAYHPTEQLKADLKVSENVLNLGF